MGAQLSFAAAARAANGSISGSVTEDGNPVANACVQFFPTGGNGAGALVGYTGPDGTFSFSVLPQAYKIGFLGSGDCTFPSPNGPVAAFKTEFWRDEYLLRNADTITVHDGEAITGIDAFVAATRPPRNAISGIVRDENGPRAGVCVAAWDSAVSGSATKTVTGPDGSYVIDVEDGTYGVEFYTDHCVEASGPGITTEWYGDLGGPFNPVTVPDDGGVSGIDELVNIPPETTITSGPAAQTGSSSAVFTFTSNEPGATFECEIDQRIVGSCASPFAVSGLSAGDHRFSVDARDTAGDNDQSPARMTWTVVPGADTTSQGTAPGGGTVSSDPAGEGATAAHPVTTAVTVPTGGDVTIAESTTPSTGPPKGFALLGYEIQITAPPATVDDPLRVVFTLDRSLLAGLDPAAVTALRDGKPAGECSGPRADPDPCVAGRRTLGNGDLELTVLTSHASTWNFGEAACVVPKLVGKTLPKAKSALKRAGCKLGSVTKKSSPRKAGTVIAQKPKAKTVRPSGAKVAVTVSSG